MALKNSNTLTLIFFLELVDNVVVSVLFKVHCIHTALQMCIPEVVCLIFRSQVSIVITINLLNYQSKVFDRVS